MVKVTMMTGEKVVFSGDGYTNNGSLEIFRGDNPIACISYGSWMFAELLEDD